ncbi:MAG: hypothetical protein WBD27_03930 [Pyrinomonadaceae bacterium]
MIMKHSNGIRRFFLIFALLIPLTFAVPAAAATSQCTTTITTVRNPGGTIVRTFTYIVWGAITGNWTNAFTFVFHNVTYTVTTNTQCAPR